jgi:hypothetical protein
MKLPINAPRSGIGLPLSTGNNMQVTFRVVNRPNDNAKDSDPKENVQAIITYSDGTASPLIKVASTVGAHGEASVIGNIANGDPVSVTFFWQESVGGKTISRAAVLLRDSKFAGTAWNAAWLIFDFIVLNNVNYEYCWGGILDQQVPPPHYEQD